MPQRKSDSSLLSAVNRDSQSGYDELDRRFRERLHNLVEREMNRRYARREGASDVVQGVFLAFFKRKRDGKSAFSHPAQLWKWLEKAARRKISNTAAKHKAQVRDIRREVHDPVDARVEFASDVLDSVLGSFGQQDPDPQIMLLQLCGQTLEEICAKVVDGLHSPAPEILDMWLNGRTRQEIARVVGCTEARVKYILDRLRGRLRRLSTES